jgi:hypothetical protein
MQMSIEMANSLEVHDSLQFENIGLTIASTKEQMIQLIDSLCFIQHTVPLVLPNERRAGVIGAGVGAGALLKLTCFAMRVL